MCVCVCVHDEHDVVVDVVKNNEQVTFLCLCVCVCVYAHMLSMMSLLMW